MTRSGVFNSVHSFTQSAIGPTILVVPGGRALLWSVVLLALRIDRLAAEGTIEPALEPRRACSSSTTCCSCSSPSPCPDRHRLSPGRRGAARRADERGAPLLRPHGRAARGRAAVPDGRRPGAALGTGHRGAGPDAPCCRRSLGAALRPRLGLALGARNPWTAADARLRRLHRRRSRLRRAVAAARAAHEARHGEAWAAPWSRRAARRAGAASGPTSSTPGPCW